MSPRRLFALFVPALALAAAPLALADTLYKCVDSEGHATYTNQKSSGKSCSILSQDKPISTFSPPRKAAGDFPRVSADTQKNRDEDRRKILENELAAEKKSLDEAKKSLAEQEGIREGGERNYERVLERLKPYQDNVALHQRNIEALEKELANLK
jgi:septal ring factor EnvC (AmiA/AmiB activator)